MTHPEHLTETGISLFITVVCFSLVVIGEYNNWYSFLVMAVKIWTVIAALLTVVSLIDWWIRLIRKDKP